MNESEVVKMRITDLLDKRSISLTGNPKTKSEALDQIVDLMIHGLVSFLGIQTALRLKSAVI